MAEILVEQEDTAPCRLVVCTSHKDPYDSFYATGEFKESWTYLLLGGTLELKNPSSSNVDYKLTLDTIEYDKRAFSPCLFTLHFSVTESNPSEPLGSLLKKVYHLMECELFVPGSEFDTSTNTYQRCYIAQSYFIHSFRINTRKDTSECVFNCYSPDRKITVKKGCEVFTARKFGEQIFKAQLDKCADMAGKYDFNCWNLVMTGFHGAVGYRDGYRDEKQKDGTTSQVVGHDVELIHPYIVRYNESLYDFFARVAHRCGEFLYFEGGQLHLGLPEETRCVLLKTKEGRSFNPAPVCYFPDVPTGEGKRDAEGFSTDYAAGVQEVKAARSYFDMQNTSDDHLYNVREEDNLGGVSDWWMLLNALSTIFTAKDVIVGLLQALVNEVAMAFIYAEAIIPGKLGKDYEKYLGEGCAFSSTLQKPNDSTFDPKNLCSSFFHNVEVLEERSQRDLLTMNFSSVYPYLTLCAAVSPLADSSPYVVTRLYGKFSSSGNSSEDCHFAEGVPVIKDAGIDSLPLVAVPPRGNIPHHVCSGPMEAVVAQNDDPLRLGRVRIRYPWQNPDDSQISPWLRVPVPFAGNSDDGGGLTMTPFNGERVIVDYMASDVERPYVSGSYFHRYGSDGEDTHGPSYGAPQTSKSAILPTNTAHTIASANGHYLSFSDGGDSSLISQLIPIVGTILDLCGVENPLLPIRGGGVTLADGSELCKVKLSGDGRCVTVQSAWGTVSMSAFTGISVSAPNGDVVIKGKNVSIEAGNNLVLKSGSNIKSKAPKAGETVAGVLGALIGQLALGTLATATGIDLRGCLDLTLLRCVLELVLRPVEGTLTVQAGRNVIFTSGKGAVTVPASCLSGEDKTPAGLVGKAIKKACSIIDDYYSDLINGFGTVKAAHSSYIGKFRDCEQAMKDDIKKPESSKLHPENVLKEALDKRTTDENADFPTIDEVVNDQNDGDQKKKYEALKGAFHELKHRIETYLKCFENNGMQTALDKKFSKIKDKSGHYAVVFDSFPGTGTGADNYKQPLTETDNERLISSFDENDVRKRKNVLKRSAVVQIILSSGEYIHFVKDKTENKPGQLEGYGSGDEVDFFNDGAELDKIIINAEAALVSWNELLSSITTYKKKEKDGTGKAFGKALAGSVIGVFTGGGYDSSTGEWTVLSEAKKLVNYKGSAGPRAVYSEVAGKGSILFSNSEGKTLLYENESGWNSYSNGDGSGVAQLVREMNLSL